VKAFLVTYDYTMGGSVSRLRAFAKSLCQNFPKLQAEGHPKWKEVQLGLPELTRGWLYYPPMERELRSCIANAATGAGGAAPVLACTQQAKVLGLCK
jgi:hypothetical protein